MNGTAATDSSFIGTTNAQPFIIKVNGTRAALLGNTSNLSFGYYALNPATTGGGNVAFGGSALWSNTDGVENTAIGMLTLGSNTSGSGNTAVGNYALSDNWYGWSNTAVGFNSMARGTEGSENTAVGAGSLFLSEGGSNTAVGYSALASSTFGTENTAIGGYALVDMDFGSMATALGYRALSHNIANGSTAVGYEALLTNTYALENTAVGFQALRLNTGSSNNAFGASALDVNAGGPQNNAFGVGALGANTSGGGNTAMGHNAMATNVSGSGNTSIGANAGPNAVGLSGTTALGDGTVTTASSQVRIGNTTVTSIGGYSAWTNLSDERFKTGIAPQPHGLDFILKLEPITYHMDVRKLNAFLYQDGDTLFTSEASQQGIRDKEAILYSGFSAQQVEQAAAEVGYDFSGVYKPQNERDHYGLAYAEFVVPLVKAVQELHAQNSALVLENTALKTRLSTHETDLQALKGEVERLSMALSASRP